MFFEESFQSRLSLPVKNELQSVSFPVIKTIQINTILVNSKQKSSQ